jgi:hypothetical protein
MNRRNFGKLLLGAIPALCLAKKAEAKALPTTKGPDGTFTFSVPARGGYTADSLGNRKPNILEFNIWVEHKWACGHTQTYRSPGYDDPRGLMFNKAVDHELLYPAPYDNVFHFADPEPCKACQTKAAWKTEPKNMRLASLMDLGRGNKDSSLFESAPPSFSA